MREGGEREGRGGEGGKRMRGEGERREHGGRN